MSSICMEGEARLFNWVPLFLNILVVTSSSGLQIVNSLNFNGLEGNKFSVLFN